LLINGKTIGTKQLASLCGASFRETNALLMELETAGVFSRDKDGIIFSRRMKRDNQKAERDKANGKAGGNPRLNPGVNPPDKAQRPEARDQKPERKIPLASSLADDWPDDFGDAFWQAYPRKTEKLAAMRKLAMLRKSGIVTFADLMAGVKRYADAMRHTEPKYVKHPTTWLNAGCWADEINPEASMATAISTRNVDLQALTSSPECIAWRCISLGTIRYPGQPIRKYLSGGLTLMADERQRMSAKVSELHAVREADDNAENRKSRLGLVANMLMAYPIAGGSEESGRARAMAYLAALDDVPPKALAEAIRRWHRSECGPGYNYHWAPAPAELRQLSMDQLRPAKDTIAHLEAVLSALSIERAMDPSPIAPEVKSESGGAVRIGMRRT
jgi:hypothetical protein